MNTVYDGVKNTSEIKGAIEKSAMSPRIPSPGSSMNEGIKNVHGFFSGQNKGIRWMEDHQKGDKINIKLGDKKGK